MSWNVLAHEYTRYNTPTGSTETEREKQRRWLQCSTWLQMLRPDIVCLQEVTPSFIEYLVLNYKEEKKKFNDIYEQFYAARTYPKSGIQKPDGCLTLIRKDKFSVKGVNSIHFKNLLSDYDPRLALAVYIQRSDSSVDQKSKAKDILILNVHLDSNDYNVRQKQIIEAVERSVFLSSDGPFPSEIVVCGDFNEDNTKNISQNLKAYSLTRGAVDQNTSIYGIIDHVYTNLPTRNLGKIEIYPESVREIDRHSSPPYLDNSFPSDHYILAQDLVFD